MSEELRVFVPVFHHPDVNDDKLIQWTSSSGVEELKVNSNYSITHFARFDAMRGIRFVIYELAQW